MSQHQQNNISGNFRTETHGNFQSLHVREDSDSTLEALFQVVHDPNTPHKQSDWSNRNLPRSFFNPPSMNQNIRGQPPIVNHSRSRSAPVQLPQSMTLPPPQPQHAKQQSVDLIEDMQTMQLTQSGWSTPNNSQADLRFSNNFNGSNQNVASQQWVNSPSKSLSASPLNQGSPQQQAPQTQNIGGPQPMQQPSLASVVSPLPVGWEMSVTPESEIYYINHNDKSTSWFHPLMGNKNVAGPIKLTQLHPQLQMAITRHLQEQQAAMAQQQLQAQQQAPTVIPPPQPVTANQQQISPNPGLIQRGGLAAVSPSATAVSQAFIQQELHKLQLQKDALHRQQEEIRKKESQLAMMSGGGGGAKDSIGGQPATNPNIQSVSTSGVDPFLGQAHTASDSHARQNSADSGLGMGTNYSLPRTPEDFLSNVDEMDSTDTGHKMNKAHSSDFNMNEMEGMGVDIGMGGGMDTHTTPMDEHDLMPSLQADIDPELLDGQKIDNLLTWL